jgi:glycyl-tRNA synthetase beta chain
MKKLPFLWEIGCEEIPASWLVRLIAELKERVEKELSSLGLEPRTVESFGTCRRLVVHVHRLADRQADRVEQLTGPPLKIARDSEGAWTKAALGFASKNGIEPDALSILETPKGEYVGFEKKVKGQKTLHLLPGVMATVLRGTSFPKFMNWDACLDDGKGAFPFGRPIRWMLSLYGEKVVPFEIRVLSGPPVRSGRKSRGHRFLGPKGSKAGRPFAVSSLKELERNLLEHYVILDPAKRRERLLNEIAKLERKAKSKCARGLDPDLVAHLVEWPGAVLGSYPKEFMSLPDEVRHTVLIHHQHYFPLEGKPSFIAVTNMARDSEGHIRRGSERVVVARLRDAKFFWTEDLKTPLVDRARALEGVSFHEKLGSYRNKTNRLVPLAAWIALEAGARDAPVRRAAMLAKCDLTSGMVGEFPELQGIMGGLYAREQGEPEPVWKAVYSQYLPQGLDEEEGFPSNREGAVVALADKIDSLAAMFAVGVVPTGSRDPFALRRAALGAIRILLESGSRLSFPIEITPNDLLTEALRIVRDELGPRSEPAEKALEEKARASLLDFFAERLRFVLSRSFRYDELNAVFALGALDRPIGDLVERLHALSALRGSEDFLALSAAFKRVGNILSGQEPGEVDPEMFYEEHEKDLFRELEAVRPQAEDSIREARYREALRVLSGLRKPVDRFFEEVLVMAEDEKLRANRLALLKSLQDLFSRVADLSQIVPGEAPS